MPNACPPDSQDWRIGGFTDSWKLSSTGFSVQEARPGPALSIIVLWPRARCCGVVGAGLRCDRGKVEIFRSVGLGLEISLNFGARWAFRLRARTPGDPGHPGRARVHTRARPPPAGVRARARTRAGLENPGIKCFVFGVCARNSGRTGALRQCTRVRGDGADIFGVSQKRGSEKATTLNSGALKH